MARWHESTIGSRTGFTLLIQWLYVPEIDEEGRDGHHIEDGRYDERQLEHTGCEH